MGANSSDDHDQQHQQLVVVGSADNDIDHHHHHQQQHVVIIRYKCSFCDRGFSNAQALGGHMNVHRRDRAAKFINNNTYSSSSTSSDHQSQLLPRINNSTKLDQEVDDDIHVTQKQHHKPQQLPLFVDTVQPSRLLSCKGTHEEDGDHEVINTKRQLMHQPASTSHGHDLADDDDRKLDLELRLGPHDPDDSTGTMSTTSTTTGTRDFF